LKLLFEMLEISRHLVDAAGKFGNYRRNFRTSGVFLKITRYLGKSPGKQDQGCMAQ